MSEKKNKSILLPLSWPGVKYEVAVLQVLWQRLELSHNPLGGCVLVLVFGLIVWLSV